MGTASGNLLLVALLAAAALAVTAATRPDVTEAATAPARTVAAVDSLEPAVLAGINKARKARGLRPLRASGALARAATRHARSMAREGYFSHTSGDGTGPSARIRRFYGGSAVGETLLWRSPGVTAGQAVAMWLSSPAHRSILLAPGFTEVGLAAVRTAGAPGAFRGLDVTILVADFGAP
ncbi:MAG: CAP domain-containing protein [Thermoleophilia bacterium]|nr:CAP domain-containing protein [Thermoleophilia bacterium]